MKPRSAGRRKPRARAWWAPALLAAALAPGPSAGATRLDLRTEPLADYYGFVRFLAARPDSAAVPAGLEPAVAGARALGAALGRPGSWAVVDTLILGSRAAADVRRAVEALPDTLHLPGALPLPRDLLGRFADGLARGERAFLDVEWPRHRASLDAAGAQLRRTLLPRWDAVLAYHLGALGMTDPGLTVPVVLVHELPEPGAYTLRRPEGGVVFAAVSGLEGNLLEEVVIHETTHALDVPDAGPEQVLELLRSALLRAGAEPTERILRDLPHAVVFFQSAETVRRLLAPDHVAYGDVRGAYSRMRLDARALSPVWTAHLDGAISREEVVEELVRIATGPR
jgi:hypothetical protein